MADPAGQTKHKRASKGERTYQRRLKEAGRKPGSVLAVQMAKVNAAGEVGRRSRPPGNGHEPKQGPK